MMKWSVSFILMLLTVASAGLSVDKRDEFTIERFISDVYSYYSEDGETISHENMLKMMEDLGLAGDHEHSHDTVVFEPVDLITLYNAFGIPSPSTLGVKKEHFQILSVPILSQYLSSINFEEPEPEKVSAAKAWGYGILSVTLVCLSSLTGVFFLSLLDRPAVMSTLVGLGVGVLLGDAVLHLIPYSFGVHSHDEEAHSDEPEDHYKSLKIGLVVLAGIYFMFVMEKLFELWGGHSHGHDHSHSHSHSHSHDPEMKPHLNTEKSSAMMIVDPDEHVPTGAWSEVKFVGWVITLSDGFHNFVDGLSLGASFTVSMSLGWTTTIAVILHEAPHEIADFAIMLRSGFTFWKAVLVNLLSALTAFIGFFIGVSTGLQSDEAQSWILALTAGIFIYISLVDLLPELRIERNQPKGPFIGANIGMLIGFLTMVLIAIFEEEVTL